MALKKISAHKNDEITAIVEQVLDSDASEIVIAIPRFSKLIESPAHFRLLKREGEALHKQILIESVDDRVIELAKNAGLDCVNPFFGGGSKQFSDIVSNKEERGHHIKTHMRAHEEEEPEEHKKPAKIDVEEPVPVSHHRRRVRGQRKFLIGAGLAVGFVLIVFAARILPRAEISLASELIPWSFDGNLIVDKEISAIDIGRVAVPGERFSEKKNIQMLFPASGRRSVQEKAKGTITIFNTHSSASQALVKSTRFATPDGKIYRLLNNVTVPGAKIEDGKIVPSSIDAEVVADKAGDQYNIGTIPKFTIPGFSLTPKAETFYGVSKTPMTGGFIGEVAYPNENDLKTSKVTIAETLESSMRQLMQAKLPTGFKVSDGADVFKLLETRIDNQASTGDQFSLYAEGELAITVFREEDVVSLFQEKASGEHDNMPFVVKGYAIDYRKGTFGSNGVFSIPLSYTAELARAINTADVQKTIAGRAEAELRTVIFSLPGVASARISLWPFWVRRVPKNTDRIEVLVDPPKEAGIK